MSEQYNGTFIVQDIQIVKWSKIYEKIFTFIYQ